MPLTPEQFAKIRNKEVELPDALKRDPLTNYFEGYFFVTLNTRGEAPILSAVKGHVGSVGADAPRCEYTELGKRVKEAWSRMESVCSSVKLMQCEVMPEHFHGLLQLLPGNKRHLGSLVSGFMSGCSHAYWDTLGIDWRKDHPTQGAASAQPMEETNSSAYARRKPDRDRDHTRSFRGPALFVRGYNDVEPITPEQVQIKIDYINKQAEKRLIQGDRHECFRIIRHAHSRSWSAEVAISAIGADPYFARNGEKRTAAIGNVLARLNDGLDYLGNKAWMASDRKLPLVCHRADAGRFEEQKEAVLKAAREGAVIVSAFISPKEREIKQQLMTEQLPFIEIMDNGFADRYKPGGKAFYACGENRLVQVTCWRYEYQKDGVMVNREMCMVMNQLARIISGCEDDWWLAQ